MRVFHGSYVKVDLPKILIPNRKMDFGSGFYTTTSKEQAIQWAKRVGERQPILKRGIVSEYELDMEKASHLTIIQFDAPTKEWLDFVCKNRCGKHVEPFDIAIGPVADDSVFATITFFENGVYTEQQAIEKLKAERLQNQILFHTEKALSLLTFVGYEEVLL